MAPQKQNDPRRNLPSVTVLLEEEKIQALIAAFSRPVVLDGIRDVLAGLRSRAAGDQAPPDTVAGVVALVESKLEDIEGERLRHVVNATGILLHTGLGRAVIPESVVDKLSVMKRCCNMQIDLQTGLRGARNQVTESLVCKLTGAEAAMLVNNNAAATHLIMAALCHGKEVIVSRGQLIEIGGSFRLPDCITESGARIVEVGATNRTHLRDYHRALNESTGAILRANSSNYRIVGFTKEVPIADLVSLKAKQDVLVIDDLGCGALVDLSQYGLPKEPTVQESIKAGADIVCFSGDKLIGGAQAGIIAGRKDLIQAIKKHPMTRMMRVCKLTDFVLEHTLRLFLEPERLVAENPIYAMLAAPLLSLKRRAEKIKRRVMKEAADFELVVQKDESAVGGGSLPAVAIPTYVLSVRHPSIPADRLSGLLRRHEPPVMARIAGEEVMMDMRTLLEKEQDILCDALVWVDRQCKERT